MSGLGFFYSLDFTYGFFYGVIAIGMIGWGLKVFLTKPLLTAVLWTLAGIIHLAAMYISTKKKVKKVSVISAVIYVFFALCYIAYCFVGFFINLMRVMNFNV